MKKHYRAVGGNWRPAGCCILSLKWSSSHFCCLAVQLLTVSLHPFTICLLFCDFGICEFIVFPLLSDGLCEQISLPIFNQTLGFWFYGRRKKCVHFERLLIYSHKVIQTASLLSCTDSEWLCIMPQRKDWRENNKVFVFVSTRPRGKIIVWNGKMCLSKGEIQRQIQTHSIQQRTLDSYNLRKSFVLSQNNCDCVESCRCSLTKGLGSWNWTRLTFIKGLFFASVKRFEGKALERQKG